MCITHHIMKQNETKCDSYHSYVLLQGSQYNNVQQLSRLYPDKSGQHESNTPPYRARGWGGGGRITALKVSMKLKHS